MVQTVFSNLLLSACTLRVALETQPGKNKDILKTKYLTSDLVFSFSPLKVKMTRVPTEDYGHAKPEVICLLFKRSTNKYKKPQCLLR